MREPTKLELTFRLSKEKSLVAHFPVFEKICESLIYIITFSLFLVILIPRSHSGEPWAVISKDLVKWFLSIDIRSFNGEKMRLSSYTQSGRELVLFLKCERNNLKWLEDFNFLKYLKNFGVCNISLLVLSNMGYKGEKVSW